MSGRCLQISNYLKLINYDRYLTRQHKDVSTYGTKQGCSTGWAFCDGVTKPCYPNHMRCSFQRDMYGDSSYCPNTEHLKYCLQFECPKMFKCRGSYCISFHMVCDGVVDCPNSEDEMECDQLSCPGLLKCVEDDICVHPNHICDGIIHCKLSMDDELFCNSKPCPQKCQCVGYSIDCFNTSLDIMQNLKQETYSIIFKQVKFKHKGLNSFVNLLYLSLVDCGIESADHNLRPYDTLTNLIHLDISWNKFHYIQTNMFNGLNRLKYLYLENNVIYTIYSLGFQGLNLIETISLRHVFLKIIHKCAFCYVQQLRTLDLSLNNLTVLEDIGLSTLPNLHTLNLTNNKIIDIHSEIFTDMLKLKVLITTTPAICCYLPRASNCSVPQINTPMPTSCRNLMPNPIVITITWLNIVFMLFAIIFTVLYYMRLKSRKVHFSLIQHLSVGDVWYIIYLIFLYYNHMIYGENFKLKRHLWQVSSMCKLLSCLFIVPLLVSQYTSWLISVNTLLLTKYALKMVNISRMQLIIALIMGWLVSCAIAIPYVIIRNKQSSMCIHVVSYDDSYGFTINVSIVSLCIIMMVATAISHYCVLKHITESSTRIRKSKGTHTKSMKIKFVSISIVNLITVTIISLLLNSYLLDEKTITYILVIILPCKTYANVLIYTVFGSGFQVKFWQKK